MRVAIVHDYLTQRGGAERVVLALHRMFPQAPIYASSYDPEGTFAELRGADVRTSFLQRLPHAGGAVRAYLPLYPSAFARFRLEGYDLVVSSSSGWAHSVGTGSAFHLCYCHTPARWLYRTDRYLADGGPVPGWGRPLVRPVLARLRRWDARAAQRPHRYVANSRNVAARIAACYGRDATVVHPPVDVGRFADTGAAPSDGHYLVVARLLPYKRVDLAVRVAAERGAPLVVVGDGPARRELQRRAGPTVRFAGRVDDAELARLSAGCRALVQCGEEDFGIAPVEANAAGRPVVAYAAGGALETVVDGGTGVLFAEQSAEGLHAALDRAEATRWDPAALRAHAREFGEDRFADRLRAVIDQEIAAKVAG